MNAKWYLSAIVSILTLLGINLEQSSVVNQEIVVQFIDDEVSCDQTQDAIAIVKKQLWDLGIENIQVQEKSEGTLKITYYSDIDVANIEKLLSQEKELNLDYASHSHGRTSNESPFKEETSRYNLNVSEILKNLDADPDVNGLVLEQVAKSDRYFKPNLYSSFKLSDVRERNRLEKVSYTIYKNSAIAIDNSSNAIPEVRAGPQLIGTLQV